MPVVFCSLLLRSVGLMAVSAGLGQVGALSCSAFPASSGTDAPGAVSLWIRV